MDIRFKLDDLEIEQPIGWDSLQASIKRDDLSHGMQFEATTSPLGFYGAAAPYLQNMRAQFGLTAVVIFVAEAACEPYGTMEEIYRGRLNFGKWKDSCGNTCIITMPAEETNCRVTFKSQYNQQVDVDSVTAFDKTTGLPTYAGLGFTMEIPAKALEVGTAGRVADTSNNINQGISGWVGDDLWIARPTYEVELDTSLQISQLLPVGDHLWEDDEFGIPLTPQLLLEDDSDCFPEELDYEFSYTGSFIIEAANGFTLIHAKLKVVKWDGEGTIFNDAILVQELLLPDTFVGTEYFGTFFDKVLSGSTPLEDGEGLYSFIEFNINNTLPTAPLSINVTFAPQTAISITATRLCPATNSQVYLVHELLSRLVESISNRCIRVKSDYYGRIDSQPFAASEDGCGGLRVLTSGLKLRQAPAEQAKFFASVQDILEGLIKIDNVGFAIEEDTEIPGKYLLRIEELEYFYRDEELLRIDSIFRMDGETIEADHYSQIQVGYEKWEVEQVNGLGEPNSNREYRTSIDTISNTKNLVSKLVAGSYPIEITRQQSFAESGAADTRYDNDAFILCVKRDSYNYIVEQDNITSPSNIFNPETLFNFRITPVRNLMRWFRSLANSYPHLNSTTFKLFFNKGTGNFIASGNLVETIDPESGTSCKLENGILAENQDLFTNNFDDITKATPIWKNETKTFEEALSIADYKRIKANPYGYISIQCGNGQYQKAYIKEILYNFDIQKATFTLKPKWS